ncbi:MAG: serine/threonine-protein kinase [Planctomycetota bacterium]
MADESESLASEVASLAQDYIDRCRAGDRPSVEVYAEEYPEFAEKIREVFPMLLMMEDLAAPPATEPSLELQSLGDFEIHRELGRGGMGTVYEATQRSLGRRVALKVCPITQNTSTLIERFRRESRAAALLHHSNIAPVFAVGEEQGFLFYCMQLIEGATLDSVIAELRHVWQSDPDGNVRIDSALILNSRASRHVATPDKKQSDLSARDVSAKPDTGTEDGRAERSVLSGHNSGGSESGATGTVYWDSVARIGVQVADALSYAHGKGTLHRDIKPSNLMLDETGMVWVLDFGLAKTTVEDDLTRSGEMVGTLRYMPPEQSSGDATELSDVYSLGLTLYELLTFRPAFEAVNRSELIRAVAESDPPAPRRINSRVPRDLETIILKACEREPAKRYESARAMQDDLSRFLARQPIRARPISIAGRVAKWAKRRPQVAALLLTLAVVFSGSFALVTWKWREAESQRVRAVSFAESERKARVAERNQFETTNEVNDFLAKILRSARPEAAGESVRVIDVMDALESEIDPRFADRPRIRGLIRREFGSTYRELGDAAEAVNQFRLSVTALREARPMDELELLDSQDKLAGALRSLGGSERLDEAEELRRIVVRRRIDLLGANHPLTARAKGNLGVVLDEKGDLAGAREMLQQSLDVMQRDPEADPIDLITCEHNLIGLMDREGDTGEAIRAINELIDETSHLPKDEPILVQLSHTLALMCHSCGRLEEAEEAFRIALHDYTRFYGEGHPKTLSTMRKLGRLLVDNHKPSAALQLLYPCIELHNELIGPGAGLTFGVRKYVVLAHEQLNEIQRAREFLSKTVEILAADRGVEHRYTREAQQLVEAFEARHPSP